MSFENGPLVHGLLCYCRPGFEPELAAELNARAGEAGLAAYARTERNSGYALLLSDTAVPAQALPWRGLIFARQKLQLLADLRELPANDRIAPILQALAGQPRFGDLWVEHPDSDAGKPLSGLARSFGNALRPALRKAGLLSDKPQPRLPRLHVCFVTGTHALLAVADSDDSAPWPLGIPRLKLLPEAPSRSALKLEEALLALLTPHERETLLRPGMRAADLGAAPGGWTWVLTRQHLHVTSVDNGPLRQHVLDSGLVDHLRADGFHWKPPQPLDWMVCDMVEQPRRVAERMATWFREGWCRHAIFNLKLPMKKRWDETRLCLDLFAERAERPLQLRAKQLYHDREEITVLAIPG
ncbi:Ribosomal RNA large subunit methyltransferase M [Xanthomonas sacchari]|uniref:23S rRNA (cytidine(2498)-2'-O)-methyltransferase RlmM n=1 Tax=Xanthomonas TaxID=338 RepID=UPI0022562744|nr:MULTISPECIES: 23S rRNA (cytidine(2498)-2'-O)-methyltransferase RlmM [Xanthomonas]MCW0396369.1 Ribosomal RNA large subunit methyltransferase M [Xanthomonas sacchari]MCW0446657.1 Ribosomal RNA large subunit methyltransferase M [Xanthomonas sacchari]MDY4338985.1 23S rRNA (cytidine(2498)-2'-O)-methyltransferase RlmM [Xanthomonas sp. LF07-6]